MDRFFVSSFLGGKLYPVKRALGMSIKGDHANPLGDMYALLEYSKWTDDCLS